MAHVPDSAGPARRPLPSTAERRQVFFGPDAIDYTLFRSGRRTIEYGVRPDCSVTVRAPRALPVEVIDRKVAGKGRWILEQLAYFRHYAPPKAPLLYTDGESHLFLGQGHPLRLRAGKRPSVRLDGSGELVVTTPAPGDPDRVRRLLEGWYRAKAPAVFLASLERRWPLFAADGYPRPHLAIRRMRRCWGSLSVQGKMTLNLDLVRASPDCIDYVVTHELCHLAHRNHGPGFHRLLDARLPGWKALKARLEADLS